MKAQAKAIIFARVSSKAQENEGYSLDSQLKLLRSYCDKKQLNIVREFKIAETASKAQRRKIFNETLQYIAKNKINHFAVEKTDRAVRNIKDAAFFYDWIEDDERRVLHCVKEGLELHKRSTSQVKLMWGIFVAFAKQYTDSLREEAMKGWAEKLAQGWLPAVPPPGYKTITEYGKKIHVPDANVAPLIKRIFQLAKLPDMNISRIAEVMANMGITTRKGRPYSKSYVHKMLHNPFYIGINRFNGKDYPGAQEPIISKKLFNEVQDKLHGRRSPFNKHNPIFKGIISCSNCGSVVTWQKQKGRYYGVCKRRSERCQGKPMLREDRVEQQVIGALKNIKDPHGRSLKELKEVLSISEQPDCISTYRAQVIKSLNRQLTRLNKMDEMLYEDKLAGLISAERYKQNNEQLAKEATELVERLTVLHEAQGESASAKQEQLSDNPIVDLYLGGTPSQKRIVLTGLFKKIYVEDGSLQFTC